MKNSTYFAILAVAMLMIGLSILVLVFQRDAVCIAYHNEGGKPVCDTWEVKE